MEFLVICACFIIAWNTIPVAIVWSLPIPDWHKIGASESFLMVAFPKGLFRLLPDLLAPLVVPIALLFTRREDNHLPWLFTWWDNDVSINGDREEYHDPNYVGTTYYANAHPRSFKARFVWLGLRNRASRLAQMLGHTYPENVDREVWGDSRTNRDHEGWAVFRAGDVYQLYIVKKLTERLCLRINYGHKIWGLEGDGRSTASVVNISFSILRWRGN